MRKTGFLFVVVCLTLASGCQPEAGSNRNVPQSSTGQIVAVSVPLQEFTQVLIGDSVTVDFPAGDHADPRNYRPDRESIATMQSADWVVTNGTGATYANWLVTVSLPESRMIPTATKGLSLKDYIAVEDVRIVHSHGPEGEHSHPTMVSRTWLNPMVASKQVKYLSTRLQDAYGAKKNDIVQNEKKLQKQFGELEQLLDQFRGQAPDFVVSATHELKFLTQSLKWNDIHLNLESGLATEECQSTIQAKLKEGNVKSGASVQGLFLVPKSMGKLCENETQVLENLGLIKVEIDMIDKPGASYFERMNANLLKIKDSLER